MLVSGRFFSVCLLRRSRRTPAALLWFLLSPCFPGKTSQRESKREPTVLFIPPAASAATPLKTSVKGGTNGADGEVFSSSSFLSHEKTFPFLSPLYLSLSPQENEPLCPFFALSSPFLQVDFFLFIPSSPWKDFPFSVPSSRREGGDRGNGQKKCLPRHECAADILTLFPIAKPNMVLAGSSAGKSHNKRSCRHPVCAPSCCRHMPPRSAHQSSGCPPRMWMCRWCTVCPAFLPWLTTRR